MPAMPNSVPDRYGAVVAAGPVGCNTADPLAEYGRGDVAVVDRVEFPAATVRAEPPFDPDGARVRGTGGNRP